MKINFLLLTIIPIVIGTAITSCSSSYKTGQTPDDVYYSPARLQTDNVRKDDNRNVQDNSVYSTSQDRYIRRRIHNRRYRVYDDGYNYPYGYYNGYNGYPVYTNPKLGTPQNTSQPRKTNLGAYTPNSTAPDSAKTYNPKLGNIKDASTTNPVRTFGTPNNSTNNGSGIGNFIRRVFNGGDNNYYNNNYNNNNSNNSSSSRSFDRSSNNNNTNNSDNNSSTKSSTPPASNSNSAPVRTFKKDN
jgi:hypothetical protein